MSDTEEQTIDPRQFMPKKRPMKYPAGMMRREPEEEEENYKKQDEEEDEEEDEDFIEKDVDDDEDEDDEDDDEDEEDDDEDRPKKKKKRNTNLFIEEEAEVDSEDDDDEFDDEDDDLDFISKEKEEAENLQPQIYRAVDRRKDELNFEDMDQVTQRLKEKYGRGAYQASVYQGDSSNVPIQMLLPTAKDPNLWLIKCRPGREKDIALNLMRKSLDYEDSDKPLQIYSVIARESLKGYIYIEARSMADVQNAIDKMNNIYSTKVSLVPMEERVDVLTIKKRPNLLKPGTWVRVSRGKYKGDLAQIIEVAENNHSVRIKIIPRLDFNAERQPRGPDGKRKKSAIRPAQRFFNHKDVPKNTDKSLTHSRGFWTWGADTFDKDGFLIKEVRTISLDTENIRPTLEEIAKFNTSEEDDMKVDLSLLDSQQERQNDQKTVNYVTGDMVTVLEGELVNAQGTVINNEGDLIVLKMKDTTLGEIQIDSKKLTKSFQIGDHVKVIRGTFKDQTGMITQVEDNIVTIFADSSNEQFKVFLKDIQSAITTLNLDVSSTKYQIHDCVQLNNNNVGVVIKIEKDQYRILDTFGNNILVKEQQISQKRDTRKAIALDFYKNSIHINDIVEVLKGENQNKQGTIMHLYRTWVFLHNKDYVDTSGMFVATTNSVGLVGKNVTVVSTPASSFKQPAPVTDNRGSPGSQFGQDKSRMKLFHQTVYITRGPYKGYQGVVKEITDKGCRVQLNTNAKIVTISQEHLKTETSTSATPSPARSSHMMSDNQWGGKTPMIGSKTPFTSFGAQTPSGFGMGGKTPAWDAGGKTPAWDAGAKTPAWDRGGKTPAWDAGGKTPAWDAAGKTPVWDAGGKTPAWENHGGRTPQTYSGRQSTSYNQDGGWAKPTPKSQPTPYPETPSATSYPTQSTPYAPMTPAAYAAPTPKNAVDMPTDSWVHPQIEVKIKSGAHSDEIAFVEKVDGGNCILKILSNGLGLTLSADMMEPIAPNRKDRCLLIRGQHKGETGTLIGMDHDEFIVRLDNSQDFHVTKLQEICKLH